MKKLLYLLTILFFCAESKAQYYAEDICVHNGRLIACLDGTGPHPRFIKMTYDNSKINICFDGVMETDCHQGKCIKHENSFTTQYTYETDSKQIIKVSKVLGKVSFITFYHIPQNRKIYTMYTIDSSKQ